MKLQITIEGKRYAAEVEVLEDDAIEELPGAEPESWIPPPGAYTPSRQTELHSPDDKLYKSPVTGLVIKVNVVPGQMIEAGHVILVLEAMKMETSITAHHAGMVKTVSVASGDSVKLHQPMVELE